MSQPQHEIMTLEEVADYLRVSERTVYDWAQKGEMPGGKIGTAWRFRRSDIEQWVNRKLRPVAATGPGVEGIALQDVLTPERVTLLRCDHKKEALTAMVKCLSTAPEIENGGEVEAEIFRREKLMSTGIGFGIGVPHVRLASVKDIVMAVGVNRTGIADYASLDETPVRIICMVAARTDQHAQYLRTLAAVSAILKDEHVRDRLMDADDASKIYSILVHGRA